MSYDNLSLGFGGTSRFSNFRGRTGDGQNRSGVRYPSPFFDIGHTYLPPSIKGLLRWCRYYYLVNPLINSVIHKMSEYPITEIVVDEKDDAMRVKWEELLGSHLRYRAFQIECGLDYYTYGMCVVTIHFPFTKWLICKSCGHREKATKMPYKWRNLDYIIECAKCSAVGAAEVLDWFEKDLRRIRMMRWNPEYINVDLQFAGADPVYTFDIPLQLRNDMLLGKKSVLDTIPDTFVECMRRNKFIRYTPDNIFVMKRPIITQKDNGYGMPLIFPVLKDTFYLQVLRKAQESIAQEHIVPLRILFPQAGSNTSDPYTTISLESWKNRIEGEIAKWKYDSNYIPILPLPVGNESIGGDGKALMLNQEMQVWSDQIVAGMGVPREFIFGGMQYSGSNVSMRMLENAFIGYRIDHENMLNQFVIPRISSYMGWPSKTRTHMRRFKMADDLQRTAFINTLNQGQKVSDETLLQEADFDFAVEKERREAELESTLSYNRKMMLANAEIQGEISVIQAKYQIEAQKMMSEAQQTMMPAAPPGVEGAPDGAGGDAGGPGSAANAAGGTADPLTGLPATGQEGEMLPGTEVDPAMPANSTVSQENLQSAGGAPGPMGAVQSPLNIGLKGGGQNLVGLAKRAVSALEQMDPATKMGELTKMKGLNPQLYSIVMMDLMSRAGSQANPLDPTQSPMPQQKPTRRPSPVG